MISIISEAAIEIGIKNMFDRKGIITCTKSISLEQAEELAIEFGAEEVEEEDEILNFYTSPIGKAPLYFSFSRDFLYYKIENSNFIFEKKFVNSRIVVYKIIQKSREITTVLHY